MGMGRPPTIRGHRGHQVCPPRAQGQVTWPVLHQCKTTCHPRAQRPGVQCRQPALKRLCHPRARGRDRGDNLVVTCPSITFPGAGMPPPRGQGTDRGDARPAKLAFRENPRPVGEVRKVAAIGTGTMAMMTTPSPATTAKGCQLSGHPSHRREPSWATSPVVTFRHQ